MKEAGLTVNLADIPYAMLIPVGGMVLGLIVSLFVYRKPKAYENRDITDVEKSAYTKKSLFFAGLAILVSLIVQLYLSQSLGVRRNDFGALAGTFCSVCHRNDET